MPQPLKHLMVWKGIGGNVYNGTLGIMSLMAPFFIGMALAEERKVDALAAGLLSVAFMTVTPYSVGEAYAVGAKLVRWGEYHLRDYYWPGGGRNVYLYCSS